MNRSIKLRGVLKSFECLMELREPHEPRHGDRVTTLVLLLARAVNYEGDAIVLEAAARLHDVGKVGVLGSVLGKAGPLTAGEWAMMKKHPQFSRDILTPLGLGDVVLDAVYQHQENFDGSGYPEGLAGEEISIEARLLRVVDVYDALVTDRAYRKGYSHEDALRVLSEFQHNFDPALLEAFRQLNFPVLGPAGRSRYG